MLCYLKRIVVTTTISEGVNHLSLAVGDDDYPVLVPDNYSNNLDFGRLVVSVTADDYQQLRCSLVGTGIGFYQKYQCGGNGNSDLVFILWRRLP